MKRGAFLAGAAGLAAAPLAAKAQVPPPFGQQPFRQQLTIAVNAPQSGRMQEAGLQIASGVQAAIDEANLYAAPNSTVFAMRVFDNAGTLAQAMTNVQFAASDPTVLGVIAGVDGSLITTLLPTYANTAMPLIVAASTADAITARGYRNVWRLPTKDSTEGRLFARYVLSKYKPKFALAVCQDQGYGLDVAQGFNDQAKVSKAQSDVYIFPAEKPDYAAAAATALTKKPDYIYLCGENATLGPIIPALRKAGYAGRFGASEGFYNQATLTDYKDVLGDALVSTSFPPLDRLGAMSSALSDFKAHNVVTILSAFAYAAAQILIAASRRTGATNRLAILSALQSTATYDTIVGSFRFDALGDPIDPNLYFYSISDGRFAFAAAAYPSSFTI